jgi:hypothetical protein
MVVKSLIERDAGGHVALTDRGRAVLRAMLPTYNGLVGLYPNNRPPAALGPDGKVGPRADSCSAALSGARDSSDHRRC